MKGHAEHDGQAYVPPGEIEEWSARDPLECYARALAASGDASSSELASIDAEVFSRVEADARAVEQSPFPAPETALEGVYARAVREAEPAVARRPP